MNIKVRGIGEIRGVGGYYSSTQRSQSIAAEHVFTLSMSLIKKGGFKSGFRH